jgi:phosphonoacetaldehyde hydrolase
MQLITPQSPYTGPLKGAILDWAGTAVDYGCLGPVAVFVDVFKAFHVEVSIDEARQFMGLMKKDHIRGMLSLPRIRKRWEAAHHKSPDADDVEALYRETEPMMVSAIYRHADLIHGLLETVAGMRQRGIKIGSCTGYTAPMMAVLAPLAEQQGYRPDVMKCSSDVPKGRPYPWMCYLNAIEMDVFPMSAMVKIGDTVSDIQEGLNAGMWTIGLTQSGNELGLSREDAQALPEAVLDQKLMDIENRFREAGVHYTANGIWACLPIIDDINQRLAKGEGPL